MSCPPGVQNTSNATLAYHQNVSEEQTETHRIEHMLARPGRRRMLSNDALKSRRRKFSRIDTSQISDPISGSSEGSTTKRKRPSHELLTEEEKKANHIASEQKRRQNIRTGFEQLIELVPNLNPNHRSEAVVLEKSIEHVRFLLAQKQTLKRQLYELQASLGSKILPIDDIISDEEN